jgi:hypothetical protein
MNFKLTTQETPEILYSKGNMLAIAHSNKVQENKKAYLLTDSKIRPMKASPLLLMCLEICAVSQARTPFRP